MVPVPINGAVSSRMVDILIVSDIRLYREGLAEMLARDGRLRLAGTAASIGSALALLAGGAVGVVLLDMAMPESLAAVRLIVSSGGSVKPLKPLKVVALGISETRGDVVSCAEAGVRGYVCRESSLEDLVAAVRCAVAGELYCPPRIAAALMDSVGRLAARVAGDDGVQLTGRELEIAAMLDLGLGNREIGQRLHISVATVKVHVHHILEKLGTGRRGEAAAKLRRFGLLQPQRLPAAPVSAL